MKLSYLHRLTLRQVDVFLAVCRHRSYSKAASQLALTQPAVSSQIRSLEDLIGHASFDASDHSKRRQTFNTKH